jgi:glycosyltransferase involved in cell wall biosynthesis
VDLALRALALVPEAVLDVVGDGPDRADLEFLAATLGLGRRVRFHGYVADPRALLSAAHAALATSRKEGLGIALLEAMAMERAVVATPVGGIPEIVRDAATGLLARSPSPDAIAASMRELAHDPARAVALGTAARSEVVARFGLAQMTRAYGDLYRTLVP